MRYKNYTQRDSDRVFIIQAKEHNAAHVACWNTMCNNSESLFTVAYGIQSHMYSFNRLMYRLVTITSDFRFTFIPYK